MATHSSILPWEIPWTEEPGELYSSWGHQRVGHDLVTKQQKSILGEKMTDWNFYSSISAYTLAPLKYTVGT